MDQVVFCEICRKEVLLREASQHFSTTEHLRNFIHGGEKRRPTPYALDAGESAPSALSNPENNLAGEKLSPPRQ